MFELIRPIERLTILGLGRSISDWIVCNYSAILAASEIWTINTGGLLFRHDVLWDMHTDEYIEALPEDERARIWRRRVLLEFHDKPVVMPRANCAYATAVAFPLKKIVESTNSTYFNNGLAYMLATALCCEVKNLSLYGVDFMGPQYERERACTMYWLGRLIQSGCKIGPCSSTELTDSLRAHSGTIYGYHEPITFDYGEGKKFAGPVYE